MQFSAVIGQDELKHHLLHEVKGGKISHAQLFLGKPGYCSLPLALAFVQYLFCENRSETDSCGECPQCRKVSELQHPDLHFSFPTVLAIAKKADAFISDWRAQIKENPYFNLHDWTRRIDSSERKPIIGVDESLEIIKKLNLKSFEGGYKVMVIWMAEEMNADCANKLLKILEEPTPKTLFILLAEAQDKMLTTILSRTQIVRVTMLPTDTIQQALEQRGITKQPQPVLPDEVTVISWKRSIYWATPKKATTIVNCSFSSCAFVSKRMSTECLAGRMPLPLKPVKDKSYF